MIWVCMAYDWVSLLGLALALAPELTLVPAIIRVSAGQQKTEPEWSTSKLYDDLDFFMILFLC
jgi:hypothetical protein